MAQPGLALTAVQDSIQRQMEVLFDYVFRLLSKQPKREGVNLEELQRSLDYVHTYVDKIHLGDLNNTEGKRLIAIIHAMDHLQRLHERCEEDEDRAITAGEAELVRELSGSLRDGLKDIIIYISENRWHDVLKTAESIYTKIHDAESEFMDRVMVMIGNGEINVSQGTQLLESIRWLNRVSKHIMKITKHYEQTILAAAS